MRAKPDELNRVARFIEPDKQEIALYVQMSRDGQPQQDDGDSGNIVFCSESGVCRS